MNYLQSGCLCNCLCYGNTRLLDFDTSQLQLQFHFLLINNGRRGFLITNKDALEHITVIDVAAIDTAKTPNVRRASKKGEIHRKNKQTREREIFQHCFQYSFKAGVLKTKVWNSAV